MASEDSQASLLLKKQLRDLKKHPVDGFSAGLVDDSNIFEWEIMIVGPPDTLLYVILIMNCKSFYCSSELSFFPLPFTTL